MSKHKTLGILVAIIFLASPALAQYHKAQGWCQQGGATVAIPGTQGSTSKFQQSFPSCTVTVYLPDGVTLATLYSDSSGTAKANPFTTSATAQWFFYAASGTYTVQFSATGLTTYSLSDYDVDGGAGSGTLTCGPAASGSDLSAQINGCIGLLPAAGGWLHAEGFGSGTYSTNMFATVTKTGLAKFGAGTFNVSATQQFPQSTSGNPGSWQLEGVFGTYFGASVGLSGTVFKATAGLGSNPVFEMYGSQRNQMRNFSIDCSLGGSIGFLGHNDTTAASTGQDNTFDNFTVYNCPIGMQFGDAGVTSSGGQFDRVYMRNWQLAAPAIQTTATGIYVDSTNALQTSMLENGACANLHRCIDLHEMGTGMVTISRVQTNVQGGSWANPAFVVGIGDVRDSLIDNIQAEGSTSPTGGTYSLWFYGSNNLTGVHEIKNSIFNYPTRIDRGALIFSHGNQGNYPGLAFSQYDRVISIGDHIGSSNTGFANWIAPAYPVGGVTVAGNVATVTMPSCTITTLARTSAGIATATCSTAVNMVPWQPFNISGTTIDSGSFNGDHVSTGVSGNDVTFIQYNPAVASTPDTGTVQAYDGFPDQETVNITGFTDSTYDIGGAVITNDVTHPAYKFTYAITHGNGSTTGGTIYSKAQIDSSFTANANGDIYPRTWDGGQTTAPVTMSKNEVSNTCHALYNNATSGHIWALCSTGDDGLEAGYATGGSFVLRDCGTDQTCVTGTNHFIINSSTGEIELLGGITTSAAVSPSANGIALPNGASINLGNNGNVNAWGAISSDASNNLNIGTSGSTWSAVKIGVSGITTTVNGPLTAGGLVDASAKGVKLPTSCTGLASGTLYNNAGTPAICP